MNRSKEKTNKLILMGLPKEEDTKSALGELVIRHGQFEYILKMTVKSLCGLSIESALNQTKKQSCKKLRIKINNEAKTRLGQSVEFKKLSNLLDRSWIASDKRNFFVHNVWAWELDGNLLLQNDDLSWRKAPTTKEIQDLTSEILEITKEINESRFEGGFLFEALKHTTNNKNIKIK